MWSTSTAAAKLHLHLHLQLEPSVWTKDSPMSSSSQRSSEGCVYTAAALWTCTAAWACASEPHLKTGNSKAAGVVRGGRHRDDEGAVWYVLVIEANGHLVITCGQTDTGGRSEVNR